MNRGFIDLVINRVPAALLFSDRPTRRVGTVATGAFYALLRGECAVRIVKDGNGDALGRA
jgi:hypothetical protein